jgi:hypothetical protein
LNLGGTQQFTYNGGTLIVSGLNTTSNATFTMASGTLNLPTLNGGGTVIFNGGTTTLTGNLGGGGSNGTDYLFNGGIISAANTAWDNNNSVTYTFGGNTSGSLSVTDFVTDGDGASRIDIDFLAGSLFTMDLDDAFDATATLGSAEWAEALWADGRLTFGGDDFSTLGNWAAVTATGGLDGTYSFDYNATTNTLGFSCRSRTLQPQPHGLGNGWFVFPPSPPLGHKAGIAVSQAFLTKSEA